MYDLFGRNSFFWDQTKKNIDGTGVTQSVAPGGGGFGGGFPGIFPGAGVSNSGWAGFPEFQARMKECMKSKTCPVTYGPSPAWF